MYRAYFIIFDYNQRMHSYIVKVCITIVFCVICTHICFDTFMSSSGSYKQRLAKSYVLLIVAVDNAIIK
jgi:hypothetical protein